MKSYCFQCVFFLYSSEDKEKEKDKDKEKEYICLL